MKECWNEVILNYGTGYIFEQRANRYRKGLRLVTYVSIAIPAIVGAFYLAFSSKQEWLSYLYNLAGILGTIQIAISVWSLVGKWEDNYSYSLEASTVNYDLAKRFERLAKRPPSDSNDLKRAFENLMIENDLRSDQDVKQGVPQKELRQGMRAALFKYKKPCATCEQVPTSMTATNCETCGDF